MTKKLMTPGPVMVEDRVLREMGSPVQAHYGHEWLTLYHETIDLLKCVFRTKYDVYIFVGSGSSGLDAAIGSMTAPGEKIIVGINGFFGNRLAEICHEYNLTPIIVDAPLGKPLEPTDLAEAMDKQQDAVALAVVHVETSTTVVNPIREIAAEAKARNVPIIVDAISSLGGLPFHMDDWHIDICVSASQKCLGAPPGLSPLAVSPQAWNIIYNKPRRGHGWYLNLQTWRRFAEKWSDWHPYPVTMATNNILALRAGLQNLLKEGIENRIARYTKLAKRLRHGARKLGLRPFTPDEALNPVVTAIYGPEGIPTGDIVRYLFDEHGIRIAGGLGEGLKDRTFRIGHLGATIKEDDIDQVLNALADFLTSRSLDRCE